MILGWFIPYHTTIEASTNRCPMGITRDFVEPGCGDNQRFSAPPSAPFTGWVFSSKSTEGTLINMSKKRGFGTTWSIIPWIVVNKQTYPFIDGITPRYECFAPCWGVLKIGHVGHKKPNHCIPQVCFVNFSKVKALRLSLQGLRIHV